jgi:hypothetical protein
MFTFLRGVFLAYITGGKSVFENVPQVGKSVRTFTAYIEKDSKNNKDIKRMKKKRKP